MVIVFGFFLIFGGKCQLVERKPARWVENKKRGGENVAILTLLPNFPSIGGCGATQNVSLRYGPIGGIDEALHLKIGKKGIILAHSFIFD